jgi:uncharacterized protein YxeA
MKILYGIIAILLIFLCFAILGGFWLKKNISDFNLGNLANFLKGETKIQLDKETKAEFKEKAKEIDDKIYQEATKHNPEGDVLPDEIDNVLKEEIKKEVKKRVE